MNVLVLVGQGARLVRPRICTYFYGTDQCPLLRETDGRTPVGQSTGRLSTGPLVSPGNGYRLLAGGVVGVDELGAPWSLDGTGYTPFDDRIGGHALAFHCCAYDGCLRVVQCTGQWHDWAALKRQGPCAHLGSRWPVVSARQLSRR